MLSEMVGRFIDRQRWLDGAGDVLERVAGATFDHLGPLSRPLEDLLHGTPAGHPVHAALTDIPVGAWTTTLALDMAGIEEGADFALNLGLAGAISAAVAGLADWRYTEGSQRRTGVAHALLNIAGTTLYAISSFQRRRGNRSAAKTTANVGYVFVLGGGFLGGDLAYYLGTMVNRNAWVTGSSPYVPVIPLAQLPENEPVRAQTNDEDLVLVRRGETVYAMGHTCGHLGGPLSEGTIEGDAIVCPWHGSQFNLEDGRVVCGPSAYHQPCYAVRVREGMVEVELGGAHGEHEPWYRVHAQAARD